MIEGADNLKAKFAAISANRDRLDGCPRHFFDPLPMGSIQLGGRVECLRCKGSMDLVALNYYIRGYEAAGKDGNDILPGWKDKPGNGNQPTGRRFFAPE